MSKKSFVILLCLVCLTFFLGVHFFPKYFDATKKAMALQIQPVDSAAIKQRFFDSVYHVKCIYADSMGIFGKIQGEHLVQVQINAALYEQTGLEKFRRGGLKYIDSVNYYGHKIDYYHNLYDSLKWPL